MFELTCHSLRIEQKETFEHGLVLLSHDRGKVSFSKLSISYESQLTKLM